ncbi:MAG: hypothetical protein AAGF12_39585, partial [Myxococcota bacterium]
LGDLGTVVLPTVRVALLGTLASGFVGACADRYSLGQNRDDASADAPVDSSSDRVDPDRGVPEGGTEVPCFVGGCSGQLCTPMESAGSTCEWRDEYACYRDATCEWQPGGGCDWTPTPALEACLVNGGPTNPPECYVVGCSSEICSADPGLPSTCDVQPEFECYRDATCELQGDGQCAWTDTPDLRMCLERFGM